MMRFSSRPGLWLVGLLVLTVGCTRTADSGGAADFSDRKMKVVVTTNVIGDLVRQVAGDAVDLTTLMGPGVDPHLYRASEGDVQTMAAADLVLYNGLHLEGKMTDVFGQMNKRSVPTSALAEAAVPDSLLIPSSEYASSYDPHVWFDVELWRRVTQHVGEVLAARDTAHAALYRRNAEAYAQRLDSLDRYVTAQAERVPPDRRVLITSHDAFRYLGRAYNIDVRGLQGISTATEAGTQDVQTLADFVAKRKIPALFVESSVSPRGIEAVQKAVEARGFEVTVGGTLYGDALGDRGTPTGTYVGALRHNIDTIVEGLRPSNGVEAGRSDRTNTLPAVLQVSTHP
jgi:manganese/zinc/iron transport system substrate-binding protein